MLTVKFWGVRGSIPTPLTPAQVEAKIKELFAQSNGQDIDKMPFWMRSTFGGNTTCVEVNCDDDLYILDMGTGVRELGKQQLSEVMRTKKLTGTILQSHVHWDHIQGLPFWAPMYLPRRQFNCWFDFYGGKQWDSRLDQVYRGQMDAPYFPVNLQELEQTAMDMRFHTIYDGWVKDKNASDAGQFNLPKTSILARKLNHPQETFGYRISHEGKTLAFTTDHEPYGAGLPRPLLELVQGVDLWITDCQYTHNEVIGVGGPQKMGWGHSFPEYIAAIALETEPKNIITTHHDPDSSDARIVEIARQVEAGCRIQTTAAHEGLFVTV